MKDFTAYLDVRPNTVASKHPPLWNLRQRPPKAVVVDSKKEKKGRFRFVNDAAGESGVFSPEREANFGECASVYLSRAATNASHGHVIRVLRSYATGGAVDDRGGKL